MTTEAQGQGQPAGTLAGNGTAVVQPAAGAQQGQLAAGTTTTATSTTVQPAGARRTMAGDLGDEALAQRLARTKEQTLRAERDRLKQITGLEDPEQLKAKWEELQNLAKKDEERRRAEMSEVEKYKLDLAAERTKREQLEQQLQRVQQEREYEQRDRQVQQLASQHVAPDALKLARIEFAEHLKGLPSEQVKRYEKNPKLAEVWFKSWVKKNPRFAVQQQTQNQDAAATTTTQPAQQQTRTQQPLRRPITNGAGTRRPGMAALSGQQVDPSMGANGKTVRPGRSNSMSPAEVREYARRHGVNYPG